MIEHREERKDGANRSIDPAQVHLGWWNESIVVTRGNGIGPAVYGERPV